MECGMKCMAHFKHFPFPFAAPARMDEDAKLAWTNIECFETDVKEAALFHFFCLCAPNTEQNAEQNESFEERNTVFHSNFFCAQKLIVILSATAEGTRQ